MTDPNTGEPAEIAIPELLEADRSIRLGGSVLDDASADPAEIRKLNQTLEQALVETAAYGRALWLELREVADYLREEVAHGGAEAAPLPRSDTQWQAWKERYAHVLSALAGPHGDSGYGAEQAELESRRRRR